MSAVEEARTLLGELRAAGIVVRLVEGGRLRVAPWSDLSRDERQRVNRLREELIALLADETSVQERGGPLPDAEVPAEGPRRRPRMPSRASTEASEEAGRDRWRQRLPRRLRPTAHRPDPRPGARRRPKSAAVLGRAGPAAPPAAPRGAGAGRREEEPMTLQTTRPTRPRPDCRCPLCESEMAAIASMTNQQRAVWGAVTQRRLAESLGVAMRTHVRTAGTRRVLAANEEYLRPHFATRISAPVPAVPAGAFLPRAKAKGRGLTEKDIASHTPPRPHTFAIQKARGGARRTASSRMKSRPGRRSTGESSPSWRRPSWSRPARRRPTSAAPWPSATRPSSACRPSRVARGGPNDSLEPRPRRSASAVARSRGTGGRTRPLSAGRGTPRLGPSQRLGRRPSVRGGCSRGRRSWATQSPPEPPSPPARGRVGWSPIGIMMWA